MTDANIPYEKWPSRLALLSGKALTAYRKHVTSQGFLQYDELKENLLQALDYSTEKCRRKFWSNTWRLSDGVHSVLNKLQSLTDHLLKDCESVHDAKHQMVMGKLLSICPHEVEEHVLLRNPSSILETANIFQEKLDTQPIWKKVAYSIIIHMRGFQMAVMMKGNLHNTLVRQRVVSPINYLNTIVCIGITSLRVGLVSKTRGADQ